MAQPLKNDALEQLFSKARTHNAWQDRPVGAALLKKIWDLAKWGPTSANCCPLRVVFVTSKEAKERLRPCLMEGNVEKTMAAPATVIFGHDMTFYERLPELFPHTDARSWFAGNAALIDETAFRNGTLQAAYFMLACRSLGLDCGPMSGFDKAKVEAEFFAGRNVNANFLCNIGYGDPAGLFPRGPRPAFEEDCQVI